MPHQKIINKSLNEVPQISLLTPPLEVCEYPQIMDVADLAQILRISVRTIYNRRSTGVDLPPAIAMKGTTKLLFSRKVVQQWLNGAIKGSCRRV